jgi:hypothetical protein
MENSVKKSLYKPQEESVDINVNVYDNENCFHDALCNDTVGCSAGNVVAGCDCGGINFISGCGDGGGGINVVPGCGG